MMRGFSGKRGLIPLQKLGFTCILHQLNEIIFLYLSMYSFLRINVKIENGTSKPYFFTCIFQTSISQPIMHLMV